MLELLAAIMLQDSSKKEFAPWVLKKIIQAIHFKGKVQHLQDWRDYPKKKYNYYGDGSQIRIDYISKLTSTRCTIHLADTSSRRGHNSHLPHFYLQTRQPPPQPLLEPAPGIPSYDQVGVRR